MLNFYSQTGSYYRLFFKKDESFWRLIEKKEEGDDGRYQESLYQEK
jgi:hypothetical protein